MDEVFWLYCKRCGWQTERPNEACEPTCPDCWANLQIARMSSKEFGEYKDEIGKSVKRFMARPVALA